MLRRLFIGCSVCRGVGGVRVASCEGEPPGAPLQPAEVLKDKELQRPAPSFLVCSEGSIPGWKSADFVSVTVSFQLFCDGHTDKWMRTRTLSFKT